MKKVTKFWNDKNESYFVRTHNIQIQAWLCNSRFLPTYFKVSTFVFKRIQICPRAQSVRTIVPGCQRAQNIRTFVPGCQRAQNIRTFVPGCPRAQNARTFVPGCPRAQSVNTFRTFVPNASKGNATMVKGC
jgi:hypothetical protein